MAEGGKKPGRRSDGTKQSLRSRGVLSHAGARVEGETELPKRSSGMLSHNAINETTPRELAPPEPSRPYHLEDK